jgi:two-component system NtrC family sensor kinase
MSGRAFLEGRTITIPDVVEVLEHEFPASREPQARWKQRSVVLVPLMRHGEAIGVLRLGRGEEVRPFTEREVALLETFAAQAVIAIENARLFAELKARNRELQDSNRQVSETLEQQTVTAEVLRVIAASPNDLGRVLTAVAESAARLCEINDVVIFGIEGASVVRIASVGTMPSPPPRTLIPLNRQTIQGRAIVDHRPVHVPDVQAVLDAEYPVSALLSRRHGTRSALAVPLLREGIPVGPIYARRN